MAQPKSIDVKLARATFDYNPDTGLLTWKVRKGVRGVPGSVAGCQSPKGYIRVKFDGRLVMAHRLAWVITHGHDIAADAQIDHENRNRSDNRLCNLRLASGSQNRVNGRLTCRNSTGFRGVYPSRGKYAARIKDLTGKRHFLGSYATPEEAHAAYMARASELHREFASNGVA